MDRETTGAEDAQTKRNLNKEIKLLAYLKCGKEYRTDRCHRICRPCRRSNARDGNYQPPTHPDPSDTHYHGDNASDLF